jgi:hypothetical protein
MAVSSLFALRLFAALPFLSCGSDPPGGTPSTSDGSACDHALSNRACWSTFAMSKIVPGGYGFFGGAFDGRYLYLAGNGQPGATYMTRFDTQGDFVSEAAWSTFNIGDFDYAAYHFAGAAFDGRYVYYAPNSTPNKIHVARYDTQASFEAPAAWSTFNVAPVAASDVASFQGAVFDGRYVYFIPDTDERDALGGKVLRYDSQSPFDAAASWSMFDTVRVNPKAQTFSGGAFDGRYLYMAPAATKEGARGFAARYDTQASFEQTSSWSAFDTTVLDPWAYEFGGAMFDGRYVYFAARTGGKTPRYDTHGAFEDPLSWSLFDAQRFVREQPQHFGGVVFDGRFAYFLSSATFGARYDTTADFAEPQSWSGFAKTATPFSGDTPTTGGLFDGRYLYFIPANLTVNLVRFDVRPTPSLPPTNRWSFF